MLSENFDIHFGDCLECKKKKLTWSKLKSTHILYCSRLCRSNCTFFFLWIFAILLLVLRFNKFAEHVSQVMSTCVLARVLEVILKKKKLVIKENWRVLLCRCFEIGDSVMKNIICSIDQLSHHYIFNKTADEKKLIVFSLFLLLLFVSILNFSCKMYICFCESSGRYEKWIVLSVSNDPYPKCLAIILIPLWRR